MRRGYFECRYGQLHVHNSIPPGGGFEEATPLAVPARLARVGPRVRTLSGLAGRDRSVYAPDLPGFGESDPPAPGPRRSQTTAAALGDFLDSMHLRQVDVLANALARSSPRSLRSRARRRSRRMVMVSVPLLTEAERQAVGQAAAPRPRADGALRPPDWQRWATHAAAQYPLRERLARLTQRLLVLRPRDELWEATGRVREALPGARLLELELPGAELFASSAARVAEAVREFLRG